MVLIAGGWFLSRLRKKRKIQAQMAANAIEAARQKALPQTSEEIQRQMEAGNWRKMPRSEGASGTRNAHATEVASQVSTKKTEVLVKHIGVETKNNPNAMAQVVRTWLNG